MEVHRFSSHYKSVRDEWFDHVETLDEWEELGPIGEGESASIRVKNRTTDMIGVAKPGIAHAAQVDPCRAAHEKLGFDLGCLLALPVSPVLLWPASCPTPFQRGRSISCWAFPQAEKWSVALQQGIISDRMKCAAAPTIAAMRVFHSWIGDTDRKGEHIMIDLNSPDDDPRLAFIDHAFSLSYQMRPQWNPCGHYLQEVPEDRPFMLETAAQIAAIDDDRVKALVTRVPLSYLPRPQAQHIIQALLARKGTLPTIMGI